MCLATKWKPSKWIWKFVFQFFLSSGDWKPPKWLLSRISKFSFWRNFASKKHAGLGTYNGHLPMTHNFLTRVSKEIRDEGTKKTEQQPTSQERNEWTSGESKKEDRKPQRFCLRCFPCCDCSPNFAFNNFRVSVVVVGGSLQITRRTLLRFVAEGAKVFVQEFVLFDLPLSFSFLSVLSSSSREEIIMRCVGACFWCFFASWKNLKAPL